MPNKRDRNKRQIGVFLDKDFLQKAKKALDKKGITMTEAIKNCLEEAIYEELQNAKRNKNN